MDCNADGLGSILAENIFFFFFLRKLKFFLASRDSFDDP